MSPFFKKDPPEEPQVEEQQEQTAEEEKWLLPEDTRKQLVEYFAALEDDIDLFVFTQEGENDVYNEYMTMFVSELARITDKIKPFYHTLDDEKARELNVTRSPSLLVSPDKYKIRFTGVPLGEEGRAFLTTLLLVSTNNSGLTQVAKDFLEQLEEERDIKVFASPTCPYCPGQIINAVRCAIAKPGLVAANCVETNENPELADKYMVGGVPHTVVNEDFVIQGLVPEDRFVVEVVTLRDANELLAEQQGHAHAHDHDGHDHAHHDHAHAHPHAHDHAPSSEVDLVIIGAGPAGLTSGIYAERSGLTSVVLEKGIIGGQVAITPSVENYPGFTNVPGKRLMDIMSEHAREYVNIHEGESVDEIKVGKNIEVITNHGVYIAKGVILTTGATYRKLGCPGEDEYFGFGVNYCASCDGYLFKGKRVAIVGGGNTALTDALHLQNLGVDVTIIHRRDEFRAQKHLQDAVMRENIPVIWNTVVKEVKGEGQRVTHLELKNTQTGDVTDFETNGMFVAIGYIPHNELAKQLGLQLDDVGFVKVGKDMRTSIPRIYAAGDLTGGVQQIVTAIGEGATAALSAFEDVSHPYWKE